MWQKLNPVIKSTDAFVVEASDKDQPIKIAEWDASATAIIAETDGQVVYNDLIENVSFQDEADAQTSIVSRKVISWTGNTNKNLKPSIKLVDNKGDVISLGGKKVAEYLLPTHSVLGAKIIDKENIKRGDVIARIPVQAKGAGDITGGLPRVNELLEVRRPSNPALLSEIAGTVELKEIKNKMVITVESDPMQTIKDIDTEKRKVVVNDGAMVVKGDVLVDKTDDQDAIRANQDGKVYVYETTSIVDGQKQTRTTIDICDYVEYPVAKGAKLLVRTGDIVAKAEKLVDGDPVPQDILRILGQKALSTFMVEQIQQVYRLQGVTINDKHIEILIREMTRRVEITDPGDTSFLMGQVVDRVDFEEENARVIRDGNRPAKRSEVLVGLTRASLTSRSFISNASFQQTTKVLVDAAISGSTDKLVGINENLIVGRLIPIGTGAYVRRVREIAREEEKAEKLAREGNGQQQLMDL